MIILGNSHIYNLLIYVSSIEYFYQLQSEFTYFIRNMYYESSRYFGFKQFLQIDYQSLWTTSSTFGNLDQIFHVPLYLRVRVAGLLKPLVSVRGKVIVTTYEVLLPEGKMVGYLRSLIHYKQNATHQENTSIAFDFIK